MKRELLTIVCLILFSGFNLCNAQEYIEMMKNPHSNYYEIQKSANDYFNKVGTGKGTGYTQYKRWEYENKSKAYPSGDISIYGPDKAIKEFNSFSKSHQFKTSNLTSWKSLGPDNINTNNGHYSPGLGRIDRVAVDPQNEDVLYAGGPTGGIWKSTNGGVNWAAKTDNVGALGVCGIVINPTNSQQVFWATGDGDYWSTNCSGIYVSNDAGETWNITGLSFPTTDGVKGRKLLMDPSNNSTLLFSSSKGIFKTTDGGVNWNLSVSGDFDDMIYKPGNSMLVYASKVGEIYRSTDGGESFSKNALTLGGRVFISVTESDPEIVYLMTGQKGIYKSTNSGESYTFVGDHPYTKGDMWHHGTFIVSPKDANLMHTGEFETHKSLDGGLTWTQTSKWLYDENMFIHCDIHDFVYTKNKLYVCSDGGVSVSSNEGDSWTILFNTMVALEPYRMTVCKTDPNVHMNGSQDNGIYLWDGTKWDGIFGADGMECLIDYKNPANKYFAIQNGEVYSVGEQIIQPGAGDWVSPMIMNPTNPSIIYFGNTEVKKTTDGMHSWTTIGTFGTGNITMMALGESNPDHIYASKGNKLWRTTNGGEIWTEISAGLPNRWITRIAVHPANPDKVAVSLGGYDSGEKVYTSSDGGANWTNYSKSLPNLEAKCLVYDDLQTDALYLGMDIGIYYIDNTLQDWELFSNDFPNVGVNDLKIHYNSDQIFAASLGRGIWKNSTKNAVFYCTAAGNSGTADDWIKNVKVGTIDNTSDKGLFEDHTNLIASLPQGSTNTIAVTLNNHSADDKCFAWIDYNNNKVFETSELISIGGLDANHLGSASFIIPEEAVVGNVAMRVRNQNSESVANPCGDDIKGEVEDYTVNINQNYCTAIGTIGTGGDFITYVKLGNIDNSTPDQAYYSDFTNLSTSLLQGKTYTVSVKFGAHWDADKCFAWIDFDQNKVFDPNETIALTFGENDIAMAEFTVPTNAIEGTTQMRVRGQYAVSEASPCGSIYGEVEDYSVEILKVATAYCLASGSQGTGGDYITNVTLGTINNDSPDQAYYTDYTSISTNLTKGSTYTISVKFGTHWDPDKCFTWIDFNQNNVFDPSEIINLVFGQNDIATAEFTIPIDALEGTTRMRVRGQWDVTSGSPCGDAFGEVEDYAVFIKTKPDLNYCSAAGFASTGDDYINNVNLESINNSSLVQTYYSDFTNLSTTLCRGHEYNLNVTLNYHWDLDKCYSWIDYNNDGIFDDEERIDLTVSDMDKHIFSAKFIVPSDAVVETTRMRIRNIYDSPANACGDLYGKVEDYSIKIVPSPEASTTSNAICSGTSANITLKYNFGAIQWEQSDNGFSDWQPVTTGSGFDLSSFTTEALTSQMYYRAKVSLESQTDIYSNVIGITILPALATPELTQVGNTLTSSSDFDNQWYNENGIINGATEKTFVAVISGDYYVMVNGTCKSLKSNTISISVPTLTYCDAEGSPNTTADWIKNVTLNTINNTSAKSGYSNFLPIYTSLTNSIEYTLSVTMEYHWDADKCFAWIDYNQNGQFEPEEAINIPVEDIQNHIFSTKFTVPSDAKSGVTRMRVRSIYSAAMNPCLSFAGEVEDYSVIIVPVVSISDNAIAKEGGLIIYPNPAHTEFEVKFSDEFSSSPINLKIYNVKGELMTEKIIIGKHKLMISIAKFNPGAYFVKVQNARNTIYKKLIVQ